MTTKRTISLDEQMEVEIGRLCGQYRCEVCIVPFSSKEAEENHYGGKIHAKKLVMWRERMLTQKRLKLDLELEYEDENSSATTNCSDQSDILFEQKSDEIKFNGEQSKEVTPDMEGNNDDTKQDVKTVLSDGPLDPRLIDNMDPATMRKMLKKGGSRWDPSDKNDTEEESEDDPEDMSVPVELSKLMRRCHNPTTGIGYCQICNKLLVSQIQARKHWAGKKHSAKLEIYQNRLLSEAAVLAGTVAPVLPPSRGYYCELCESDCSSKVQMDQHLRGERHRTNVRRMERELAGDPELDKDINPYNIPEQWLRERKHCNLCDVPVFSIRIAKIHFNSRQHRLAAGLNILSSHEEEGASLVPVGGKIPCDTCNIRVITELDMKVHTAGIRHIENYRTRAAVELHGMEWKIVTPFPPDPPKNSVRWIPPQMEPVGFSPMCGGWGGPMGRGWGNTVTGPSRMNGPGPMMGPGPNMWPRSMNNHGPIPQSCPLSSGPISMMTRDLPDPSDVKKKDNCGAGSDIFNCHLCRIVCHSAEHWEQHQTGQDHQQSLAEQAGIDKLRAESELEEVKEDQAIPLQENPLSYKTKSNPFHCPLCKIWVPTITLLKFYHRQCTVISSLSKNPITYGFCVIWTFIILNYLYFYYKFIIYIFVQHRKV